jgi:hypothetical protein
MAATSGATLQYANPNISTVSRKPQSTANAGGAAVPFIRQSRKSQIQGFSVTGQAFGSLITQPLKAVGGYLRGLFITITASGGVNGSTTVAAAADAPENIITSLLLRDPLGQPIVQVDGYGLRHIDMWSGQFGMAGFQDPKVLPSFSAVSVGGSGTGNFTIRYFLPLELDSSAYCAIASLNASAVPTLQIQLAASSAIYTTAPGTLPTLAVTVDQLFWAAPIGSPDVGPPDIGSSAQWSQSVCAAAPPSNGYSRLVLPRVGTFIHTLILVSRDSTGARVDNFPSTDLTLFVDGVPVVIETESEHYDRMYVAFGLGKTTGVLPFTFRQAVQRLVGDADTHDELLATTPATLLEVGGTWQTYSNTPGQVAVYTGELYPVSGIPYNHLAQ